MKKVLTTTQKDIVFQTLDPLQTLKNVCEENRWGHVVMGRSGMIGSPYTDERGWTFYPLDQYKGSIPPEAQKRINALKVHIPDIDFIIADEPEPEPIVKRVPKWAWITAGVAAAPLAIVSIAAILVPLIIVGSVVAVIALFGLDPVCVAVLPDGTWVVIYRWFKD